LILPYITYRRFLDCRTPLTIQTFPEELPAICSDNPIIFESSTPDIYYDDVIFPLTHTHVFVRAKGINNNTDIKYVEMLNELYEKKYASIDQLKNEVFDSLIEK